MGNKGSAVKHPSLADRRPQSMVYWFFGLPQKNPSQLWLALRHARDDAIARCLGVQRQGTDPLAMPKYGQGQGLQLGDVRPRRAQTAKAAVTRHWAQALHTL